MSIQEPIEWVRAAGAVALHHYQSPQMSLKGEQDYLSQADRDIEDRLVEQLAAAYPDIPVLAEERGGGLTENGSGFIIDPLDGTENFLRKVPLWCICLSYVEENEVVWSIVYNPVTEELFQAERGLGAFVNGKRMQVSQVDALSQACVCVGHSYRTDNQHLYRILARLIDERVSLRLGGSGALGLAYVACGRYDAFFEEHLNIWDFIHSALMIREAGGIFADFSVADSIKHGHVGLGTNARLNNQLTTIYLETERK